jgi:hypothetical protein
VLSMQVDHSQGPIVTTCEQDGQQVSACSLANHIVCQFLNSNPYIEPFGHLLRCRAITAEGFVATACKHDAQRTSVNSLSDSPASPTPFKLYADAALGHIVVPRHLQKGQ